MKGALTGCCSAGNPSSGSMMDDSQKKRVRLMAVLLGLVAACVYIGFIWMTSQGYL